MNSVRACCQSSSLPSLPGSIVQASRVLRLAVSLIVFLVPLASCSREEVTERIERSPATPIAAAPPQITDERFVGILAPLIDPAKLDTLKGDRAANPRLRKIVHWLEVARREGIDPGSVIDQAQARVGYAGTARAREDKKALLRNLIILERLGCLDAAGMEKLRRGNAPTITLGPYAGDIAAVDHIIPRSVAPELDEKLFNLEFMPSKLNSRKGNEIGQRQLSLASSWRESQLLTARGKAQIWEQREQSATESK
jgi:hypothetical protein